MFLAFDWGAANDAITAVLVIAVGAVLRGLWSIQQRLSRMEGLDEMKERQRDLDRKPDPPYDQEKN